ncbi:uncharacterized protein C8A04DRAFT_8917 [Dichotomopilus funicola]|uniref:Arrestin C-terminal-like domain-containing protein n=1 Tax=Dichotomopilus funicola TaxID=1934379 RepID=A0AAN6ZSI4_9PEZI|nr:hypothetical protein C8A04DRAFT_8917 [Dichotomopilus funicola]
MRSLNPFGSASGRYTFFDVRLDNDFIVFRGNDHEASGQLLKGTVVLCLHSPLKLEAIHLKLVGAAHYTWTDAKVTATGISTHKVAKTAPFLEHRWTPFEGIGALDPTNDSRLQTRGITLDAGNYEWPFELMLDGDTTESVEGLREAGVQYKLKATIARGKLMHDIHAYKQFRVIRTLEASALEFLHAMSIENIWPNKIDYSIVVPQKAVVFGSCIPVEMRFTPLLKGLEIGDVTIKLIEIHDIILHGVSGHSLREHKKEREIDSWTISVTREEHWQDVIQDSGPEGWEGQEGWVVHTTLNLPKRLTKCLQDVNVKGIKIRHKLKVVVALNNPDGHVSELRATLPVSIFISPNMPLDETGTLVRQLPSGASREAATIAPPAYEHHRLDQLYADIEPMSLNPNLHSNLNSPLGGRSGVNSPFPGHSRAGSTENLPALLETSAIQPDVLAHRLHSMSLEDRHRNTSWNSNLSAAGGPPTPGEDVHISPPTSAPLTRHNSGDSPVGSHTPPEHLDFTETSELSKVPSYQTAVRTPVRSLVSEVHGLPDYQTALSAPSSPPGTPRLIAAQTPTIAESIEDHVSIPSPAEELLGYATAPATGLAGPWPHISVPRSGLAPTSTPGQSLARNPISAPVTAPASREPSPPAPTRRPMLHRRQFSASLIQGVRNIVGDGDEGRRLHLLQARIG